MGSVVQPILITEKLIIGNGKRLPGQFSGKKPCISDGSAMKKRLPDEVRLKKDFISLFVYDSFVEKEF